jgi:hypothetical protein
MTVEKKRKATPRAPAAHQSNTALRRGAIPRVDEDARTELREALAEEEARLLLGAPVARVAKVREVG